MQRKKVLEERIDIILMREAGIPYSKVLEVADLTPQRYFSAVTRLERFIESSQDYLADNFGKRGELVLEIFQSKERKERLFRMEEQCLREQYDDILAGRQRAFVDGTFKDRENVRVLVYHALTRHIPALASSERSEVITAIQDMPTDVRDYLHEIGLHGLMMNGFERGRIDSPLAVFEEFDVMYKRRTGDAGLFDLTQKEHIHPWNLGIKAPNRYWKDCRENVQTAIYHVLTEQDGRLASSDRETVIKAIYEMRSDLYDYLHEMGFGGLMMNAFNGSRKDSVEEVFREFDKASMKATGNASLFDRRHKTYIAFGSRNMLIRKKRVN